MGIFGNLFKIKFILQCNQHDICKLRFNPYEVARSGAICIQTIDKSSLDGMQGSKCPSFKEQSAVARQIFGRETHHQGSRFTLNKIEYIWVSNVLKQARQSVKLIPSWFEWVRFPPGPPVGYKGEIPLSGNTPRVCVGYLITYEFPSIKL